MIDKFLLSLGLVENKTEIIIGAQFLIHKSASYYVSKGRKSFKGLIKFILGKDDPPKYF